MVMDMCLLEESESDWAWLPKHLLDLILDKLISLSDYACFGAVCKPWHSVAMENKDQFLQNKCCRQVPFLMVSTGHNSDEIRSLYSITTHNKLDNFPIRLPYKKRLSGSSHAWLFTVEETFGLTLTNPFSGATIELPPIMDPSIFEPPPIEEVDFEYVYDDTPVEVEFEVTKATLSADPASSPNDYIVSAIYSGNRRLAFIQPGDKAWTYIDTEKFQLIYDVIYYKGQIYAVDYWSGIIMVDLNRRVGDEESKAPQVKVIAPRTTVRSQRTYLVESSSGDLLLVQRFIGYEDIDLQHETSEFKVFKVLLQKTNKRGWPRRVEVKSLGGDTLFLGDSHSICVSASKWPGCQPNSIYYTDDYIDILLHPPYGRRDIGIFNLENGSFENGSFGKHCSLDPSHKHMVPSIWIVPSI